MSRLIDMTGKKFGRLKVIKRTDNLGGRVAWWCMCDCGNEKAVRGEDLRAGHTRSCGCLQREVNTKRVTTHGMYGTRLHKTWRNMKERCNNPNEKSYHNYGGRGITYCDEWEEFQPFHDWAMSNGYSDKLTIDRINVNGNYEPSNCRWVDKKVQGNNTRVNRIITIDGIAKTLTQWSDETGVNVGTIWWRYNNGITGQDLIKKGRLNRRSL